MRVLLAASEVYPFVKTGGLADVAGHLPSALVGEGIDIRIVVPGYRQVLERAPDRETIAELRLPGLSATIRVLATRLQARIVVYIIDTPELYDRPGGPYIDALGDEWIDNAHRFYVFSRSVIEIAQARADPSWFPDVVHCNDWHTGLIPALLHGERDRPATVFTIHNLAYQGRFPHAVFQELGLPTELWHPECLEFYGNLNFMKAGLVFADRLTTVSPTYAREILEPQFGYGLDGVLKTRQGQLVGILNGIDNEVWNPESDPWIDKNYAIGTLDDKVVNKLAVQREFKLAEDPERPLVAVIGRLADQKGIDLIVDAIPEMVNDLEVNLVILGSGGRECEQALREVHAVYSDKVGLMLGFNEPLAHRMEAGADLFLMPSRFEPCGLNQMYSQRYGTVPVVHAVGGLVDTVVDVSDSSLEDRTATGFVFHNPRVSDMLRRVDAAIDLYRNLPFVWREVMINGMCRVFSWQRSAVDYCILYQDALENRRP